MRQEVLRRSAMRVVARENVRLTKDRQELQTRKLIGHLDVGAVVAYALAALAPHLGPLRTGYKVEVPLRACPEFRCAIAEKGIPSGPNLVRESDDERSAVLAERPQVWVVVRNISEFDLARALEPVKYAPLLPVPVRPPQDLASDHKRRFPFQDPYQSHLRSG